MKNLVYILMALLFLTGCPKKEEIEAIQVDLLEKKTGAIEVIQARNFSLDELLKAQDYFFAFSERVHLMIVDEDGAKGIRKLIEKKGVKKFCTSFVLPITTWQAIESYCSEGQFYRCSPEIKEYQNTYGKFKELIGNKLAQGFDKEPACNN